MSLFKIKICGIRFEPDLFAALDAGADAIGLNFYSPSVRSVSIEQATTLAKALVDRETQWTGKTVGVFVNHSAAVIAETVQAANLGVIQLHGDERPEFISQIQRELKNKSVDYDTPIIRAVRVAKDLDKNAGTTELQAEVTRWKQAGAEMVLLDAAVPGSFGGTGARLDWHALRGIPLDLPFALAGGLTPDNVADAISIAQPDAVDAASGVENSAQRKDADAMIRFVEQANKSFSGSNS